MALDKNIKKQLENYIIKIVDPIEIYANINDTKVSMEMKEILEEVSSLSDKISVKYEAKSTERTPSFGINKIGETSGVRFAGIPLGHEFGSLVLSLLQVSGHPPKIDEELISKIKSIKEKLEFETFISLSCQNCPEVVQSLNIMAILNPNISHTMVDGGVFQDEIKDKNIMSVPAIYLNGEFFEQGRLELTEILGKIDSGLTTDSAKLNDYELFDVLVIGGGPAGASAAIYAARKGIKTGIVTKKFGGQVLDTAGIENFISLKYLEGINLVSSLKEHVSEYDIDIINLQKVVEIKKVDKIIEVSLESGAFLKSKTIIIATGAKWKNLNIPGEKIFKNKGVAYCPHCDGPIFKGKNIAVIGGGNSGVEAAIDLSGMASYVTLLEFSSSLKADLVLKNKLEKLKNVKVICNAKTTEFLGENKINGLKYFDLDTNNEHNIDLEGIFVQIGLSPNTSWLGESIDLNNYGEVIINNKSMTSIPGVFAAGDCTTVPYKQIIISMGEGAKASLAAFEYLMRN